MGRQNRTVTLFTTQESMAKTIPKIPVPHQRYIELVNEVADTRKTLQTVDLPPKMQLLTVTASFCYDEEISTSHFTLSQSTERC